MELHLEKNKHITYEETLTDVMILLHFTISFDMANNYQDQAPFCPRL